MPNPKVHFSPLDDGNKTQEAIRVNLSFLPGVDEEQMQSTHHLTIKLS
jgi:hypothetical protein